MGGVAQVHRAVRRCLIARAAAEPSEARSVALRNSVVGRATTVSPRVRGVPEAVALATAAIAAIAVIAVVDVDPDAVARVRAGAAANGVAGAAAVVAVVGAVVGAAGEVAAPVLRRARLHVLSLPHQTQGHGRRFLLGRNLM